LLGQAWSDDKKKVMAQNASQMVETANNVSYWTALCIVLPVVSNGRGKKRRREKEGEGGRRREKEEEGKEAKEGREEGEGGR
jgi:hypothetical protein